MRFLSVLISTAMFLSAAFPTAADEGIGETGKGRFWFFVENIVAGGDDGELRLWVAQPVNHPGQDIEIGEIYPEPYDVVEDDLSGNRIIFWRVTDFDEDDGLLFYYDFDYSVYEVNVDVDPAAVEPYDEESEEYIRYTESEYWIDVTDAIIAKSEEIVGGETKLLLGGTPPDRLPEEMVKKMEESGFIEIIGVLPRNLKVLLERTET